MHTRSALRWASLSVVAAAAIWGASTIHSASAGTPVASPALVQSQAVLASLPDVAERVVPSVVNLAATRNGGGDAAPSIDGVDPMLRDFFFGPDGPQMPGRGQERSLGSGVIVSADGLVVTSAHVVDGAEKVDITLHDGREVDGTVVGTDRRSDVAVVRIARADAHDLVPLPMGDSSALRLGEVVLAIGNPFGVGQTVTMGIVSAKGRSALGIVDYEDFIQTDAAINPGNSGGALVNLRGELVGVNTAILSRSGGSQGIGFAIPTAMIRPIMKSLVATGKVARGWLGVGIQDVDRDLAAGLGLTAGDGVLVGQVEEGTPAARAGIQRGDVIRAVGGEKVHSSSELRNKIAALAPGSTARLEVVRKGAARTLDVKLGALPEAKDASGDRRLRGDDRGDHDGDDRLGAADGLLGGATLRALDPGLRERLEVPADVTAGVVVEQVAPASAAERLGLRPGDVILEIDRKPVKAPADARALSRRSHDAVAVLVLRDGHSLYLAARR